MSNIVVYGKGKTGISMTKLLESQNEEYIVWDDRDCVDGYPFDAETKVVVSPGVSPHAEGLKKAVSVGADIVSEIDFCASLCKGRIVSVTGTNGKTTTCNMIYDILSEHGFARLLGNGGVPFSAEVADVRHDETVVLECSSFQLGTCKTFAPNVSVFTNLAPDHLDYHGSFVAYAKAKCNVFRRQNSDGYAIFNADDERLRRLSSLAGCRVLYYSLSDVNANCFFDDSNVVCRIDVRKFCYPCGKISRMLAHNKSNVLAAIAACVASGISLKDCVDVLQNFSPLPHRVQTVASYKNVIFVDDSKGTNIHAARSAIACFDCPIALIVGGSDKGENFDDLFPLPQNVVSVFAVGQTSQNIVRSANKFCCSAVVADGYRQAVCGCYDALQKVGGGVVLMSNACASFDMFDGYADRGNHFAKTVKEFIREQNSTV